MLGQQEETNIDNLLIWEQRSVLGKRGNINIIIIKLKPLSTSHTNHILHSILSQNTYKGKREVNIK